MFASPEYQNTWAFLTQFDCIGFDEKERWEPIKDYEGFYEVSTKGKVRSISRLTKFGNQSKIVKGRELIINRRIGKYPIVILSKENVQHTHSLHRLVAETFIPNPDNLPCVNHVLGDKNDNRYFMLEWCTYSENFLHAYDLGLNTKRKLTREDVLFIRQSDMTDIELGKKFNVRQGNIWNIRNRKSWKHL